MGKEELAEKEPRELTHSWFLGGKIKTNRSSSPVQCSLPSPGASRREQQFWDKRYLFIHSFKRFFFF